MPGGHEIVVIFKDECYGHKKSWLYPLTSQKEGNKVFFFTTLTDFSEIELRSIKNQDLVRSKVTRYIFFNSSQQKPLVKLVWVNHLHKDLLL